MKTYKLKSWPDLPPAFRRMAYRRLLSDLSQRHIGELELRQHSGLSGSEVRGLLQHLETEGLLDQRDSPHHEVRARPAGLARLTWPLQQLLMRRAD